MILGLSESDLEDVKTSLNDIARVLAQKTTFFDDAGWEEVRSFFFFKRAYHVSLY